MARGINHYASERNMVALKRALDTYEIAPADAVPQLTYLAESGSPMGMIFLGYAYRDGNGVLKDLIETEKWYQRAADLGSILALYELGRLYVEQKRFDAAKQAFRFAAARGYAPAQFHLGRMYYYGWGVEKDIQKAQSLWEDASAQGHVFAKSSLGHLLIDAHLNAARLVRGINLIARALIDILVTVCVEGPGSDRFR